MQIEKSSPPINEINESESSVRTGRARAASLEGKEKGRLLSGKLGHSFLAIRKEYDQWRVAFSNASSSETVSVWPPTFRQCFHSAFVLL